EFIPGAKTRHQPLFHLTEAQKKECWETLQRMIELGQIRPSKSQMASSILFVKKKDGKLRMCVDYRYVNSITKKNVYPLPLQEVLTEEVRGADKFTKLDLLWGYNQMRIREGDEWKTAFKTPWGLFEYLVMPFGFTNAPAAFQHMMNDIFRDMLGRNVAIYLDDILIFTHPGEKHEDAVKEV